MKRFREPVAAVRGEARSIRKTSQQHDDHRRKEAATKNRLLRKRKAKITMGQKVNPIGLRVGINRTWDSRWYAGKRLCDKLVEDLKLREYVPRNLKAQQAISKVIIERAAKNTKVTVHTARPGVIIGKKGADIEKLARISPSRAGSAMLP
jgi:hypothetical protein